MQTSGYLAAAISKGLLMCCCSEHEPVVLMQRIAAHLLFKLGVIDPGLQCDGSALEVPRDLQQLCGRSSSCGGKPGASVRKAAGA